MVILSMTIERMSIVWEERGASEALQEGVGSLLVAAVAYVVMGIAWLEHIDFRVPRAAAAGDRDVAARRPLYRLSPARIATLQGVVADRGSTTVMFGRYGGLAREGVLGLNKRNGDYILRFNPRRLYPLVDDKLKTKRLALRRASPCRSSMA